VSDEIENKIVFPKAGDQEGHSTSESPVEAGVRISKATGKPVRKYTRRKKVDSENAETNQGNGIPENDPVIDPVLYRKCFGESVKQGLSALSDFAVNYTEQRLIKVGDDPQSAKDISKEVALPDTTRDALGNQAEILAMKYKLLEQFGVESIVIIEFATWGAKVMSVNNRITQLENKMKKEQEKREAEKADKEIPAVPESASDFIRQ